jgi:hypothetical protein
VGTWSGDRGVAAPAGVIRPWLPLADAGQVVIRQCSAGPKGAGRAGTDHSMRVSPTSIPLRLQFASSPAAKVIQLGSL